MKIILFIIGFVAGTYNGMVLTALLKSAARNEEERDNE